MGVAGAVLGRGVLAAAGLWLRGSLEESPRFLEMGDHARVPLAEVARDHWRLVLLTAGGLAVGYAVFYAVTTWALAYGVERLGVSRTVMLACIMAAVVVKGALTPLVALLGDRYGRRPLCMAGCAGAALWMFPMIGLLSTGEPLLMFLGFLVALSLRHHVRGDRRLSAGAVRAAGALHGRGLGYNLGGVLGGALTPVVATAVASGERVPWGVAAYLTGIALLSLGCFALLPETRPVPRLTVVPVAE